MPGIFSEDLKRRVREANNIADVIQAAVGKLTRAGRNLKACCPFHNEKTASFNVNAEGQYFKCFGCGKSGDVFTFVMLFERVEFPEAFRILADRAGIRVEVDPKAAQQYKKETDWKSYLFKLNDAAARFYREQLFGDAGKAAREYLHKRGLSEESCELFRLGYAPAGGSPLTARLQSLKAPVSAIMKAGLASQRDDGSIRDFFYDRLMFPICDIQGRVIAFGGRVLGDGEPKYLNTRDTPLFSKTQTVYGLDHARAQIVATRQAVLVEGYTDVMMCHQYGISNVVACLGTAITPEHVRQLRRVADELILLTDADKAGEKASERSLEVLLFEQMPAKVARLPDSQKDPCDFLLANGAELFRKGLEARQDLFEYKFEMVRKKHNLLTPMGVKSAAEELMALISIIPDTLLKNTYRYEVLKRLNVDERDLHYEQRTAPGTRAQTPVPEHLGESGNVPPPDSELARAERELLRFLFHQPGWIEAALEEVDLATLSGKPEVAIGRALLQAVAEGKLPPDANVIAPGDAGSVVAREILDRLHATADDGVDNFNAAAQAVCVSLAEEPLLGSKLETGLKLQMLVQPIRQATLLQRYQDANRRWTQAKLDHAEVAEEAAYREVVMLRKELSGLKSRQTKALK